MNKDQLCSLVRHMLTLVGTLLVSHGLTTAASIVNSEDFIGVILGLTGIVWSYCFHSASAAQYRLSERVKTALAAGQKLSVAMLAVGLIALTSGCAKVAYTSDKGTLIHERVLGIDITASTSDAPGKVRVGYVSSVIAIVPTSTNQLYAAPMLDTFDDNTSWLVNTKMSERVGSGIAVSNLAVATSTNFYALTNK